MLLTPKGLSWQGMSFFIGAVTSLLVELGQLRVARIKLAFSGKIRLSGSVDFASEIIPFRLLRDEPDFDVVRAKTLRLRTLNFVW